MDRKDGEERVGRGTVYHRQDYISICYISFATANNDNDNDEDDMAIPTPKTRRRQPPTVVQ